MKNSVKTIIVSLFLAVMFMSFTTNSNAPLWVTHVDPLGFQIDFPSTPARNVMPLKPGIAQHIKLEQHVAGFPKFILIYKERVNGFVNINKVLNTMVDNHAIAIGGTVVKRIPPNAWKGGTQVSAEITNPAGVHCNIRSFIKGNKSYLMIVELNGKFAPMPDVNKFWNSIKP